MSKEEIAEIDKKIFEDVSKYLDREKAKKLLMESTEHTINGTDYPDEVAMKYGEAAIYLKGIGELEKVREEIYNSEWYKSHYDENGN